MSRVLVTFLIVFALLDAHAQSSLPPCPNDTSLTWTNCFGTATYANGDKYVGEFSDGKRNGRGTYTFVSGNEYIGDYRNGQRTGKGTFIYADGQIYAGEWQANQRHGRGTHVYLGGAQFVGEWADDTRYGMGILYARNGTVTNSGTWVGNTQTQSHAIFNHIFPFDPSFAVTVVDALKQESIAPGAVSDNRSKDNTQGGGTQLRHSSAGSIGKNARADSDPLAHAKTQCKELGFKERTEKFGTCVLDLSNRPGFRNDSSETTLARSDASPDDKTCVGYGYSVGTTGYADCRLKLDQARREYERDLRDYEAERAEYDRRAAAIQEENERQAAEALGQYGMCLASCRGDFLSCSSRCGSGSAGNARTIGDPPAMPSGFTTYILNGKTINCSRLGSIVTCN